MRGQCQLLDKNHQYFQLFHCQQTQSLLITLYYSHVSNVAAFENNSPRPTFIIFNTDEETDFKCIRERNFWISESVES
jgi:hypothetical protein